MKNDQKGFKEIYRVLKDNGKALIIVDGKGGLISEIFNLVLRPFFKKNNLLFDKIFNSGSTGPYDIFITWSGFGIYI